jgi:hypothetical protein
MPDAKEPRIQPRVWVWGEEECRTREQVARAVEAWVLEEVGNRKLGEVIGPSGRRYYIELSVETKLVDADAVDQAREVTHAARS